MLAVKWFRCCRSDEVEGYIRFGGRLMEELAAERLAKAGLKRDVGASPHYSLVVEALQYKLLSFVPFDSPPRIKKQEWLKFCDGRGSASAKYCGVVTRYVCTGVSRVNAVRYPGKVLKEEHYAQDPM